MRLPHDLALVDASEPDLVVPPLNRRWRQSRRSGSQRFPSLGWCERKTMIRQAPQIDTLAVLVRTTAGFALVAMLIFRTSQVIHRWTVVLVRVAMLMQWRGTGLGVTRPGIIAVITPAQLSSQPPQRHERHQEPGSPTRAEVMVQ